MNIIFEDDNLLVIDKDAGVVVNNSATTDGSTLQNEISSYLSIKGLGIGDRAGIVHRIDKETSGVLLVAKTQENFEYLQKLFLERKINKEYLALVHNHLVNNAGNIKSTIGRIGKFGKFGEVKDGKESETNYEVVNKFNFREIDFVGIVDSISNLSKGRVNYLKKNARGYSLVNVYPKTGRTHQIRVHLKSIGNPLVSDNIYAPSKLLKFDLVWCPRLFLHAKRIEFDSMSGRRFVFESPLPYDLEQSLKYLELLPNERV